MSNIKSKGKSKVVLKKVISFLLGLLMVILLLELGLSAYGPLSKVELSEKEGEYTILCLGNSHTEGRRSDPESSYPYLLQAIFDSENISTNVNVINGGLGNQNTAELLEELPSYLLESSPQLIVLQTGEPNDWNKNKYSNYLKRKKIEGSFVQKGNNFLWDLFNHLRVFRLIVVMNNQLGKTQGEYCQPAFSFAKETDYTSINIQRNDKNWSFFDDKKTAQKAVDYYLLGIKEVPKDPFPYQCLGEIFMHTGEGEIALSWLIKGVKIAPNFRKCGRVNGNYNGIKELYSITNDTALRQLILKQARDVGFEDLNGVSISETEKWATNDILEMVRLIKEKEVKLIIMNYHSRFDGSEVRINPTIKKIVKKQGIPFIDSYSFFNDLWEKGESKEDYYQKLFFRYDDHLNTKGNELVANNLLNKIMANKSYYRIE